MKSRAKVGHSTSEFSFVSGADLAEAWQKTINQDLHQCFCRPWPGQDTIHHPACVYVRELDHATAVVAAAEYITRLGPEVRISPSVTIEDVIGARSVSHSQAELTLSLLTDTIEIHRNSLQLDNGRHRVTAILDVAPQITGVPIRYLPPAATLL